MIETHPFGPFLPENIRFVIVGTFPGRQYACHTPEEIEADETAFSYGGGRNQFWKIMMQIFNVTLKTRDEKKAFLASHRIGLMDLYYAIDRWRLTNSDKDLHIIKTNKPALKELLEVESIERFYCTGIAVAEILKGWFPEKRDKIFGLPSPSPALRIPFDVKIAAYKAAFVDIQ
jgi:G:T/U-mismatch repair DNA glycosylase